MNTQYIYSVPKLLNGDLDPSLDQQILEEMKSPLLQQSICISTDGGGPPSLCQRSKWFKEGFPSPQRPIIPPQGKNTLDDYQKLWNNSITAIPGHQMSSGTIRCSSDTPIVQEAFVSPFDLEMYKSQQPDWLWCCQNCNVTEERDNQLEIYHNRISPHFKRRKIFKNFKESDNNTPYARESTAKKVDRVRSVPLKAYRINFQQAIRRLRAIDLNGLADFFDFLRTMCHTLRKLYLLAVDLQKNEVEVFVQMANCSQYIPSAAESIQNQKILHRLRAKNFCEIIKRITMPIEPTSGEGHLNSVFHIYNHCEMFVKQYLSHPNRFNQLRNIYAFINQNFVAHSFQQQLIDMMHVFGLYELDKEMGLLEYIWHSGRRKTLSETEFLQGLGCNEAIIRSKEFYQDHLTQNGFKRNV